MRILLLANPTSGSGRAAMAVERMAEQLKAADHDAMPMHTRKPSVDPQRDRWLDEALGGIDLMVVAGGDGTVRAAIGAAARTQTPIYHLPHGTENLFAMEFRMDRHASTLLESIAQWNIQKVDMGIANDEPFALMASIGFDAEVVHELGLRRGASISHWSYLRPILSQWRRWRPTCLEITVDGERIDDGGPGFVFIANCKQYGWRFNPASKASMMDGVFDIAYFPTRSRLEMFGWAVRCRTQQHLKDKRLIYCNGRGVEVRGHFSCRYQLDGDPAGLRETTDCLPQDQAEKCLLLTAEIQPASLPVLIPHPTKRSAR